MAGSSGKLSSGPLDHPVMFVSLLTLGSVVLDFDLGLTRIGRSSATLAIHCSCAGQARFDCSTTMIHAQTGGGTSVPWPDPVRARMAAYLTAPVPTAEKKSA